MTQLIVGLCIVVVAIFLYSGYELVDEASKIFQMEDDER